MNGNQLALTSYYRTHAGIYDATRWSFLFGRSAILDLAACITTPQRILEIGCGTGRNLLALCRRFPKASVTGVDLSAVMLAKAQQKLSDYRDRVQLHQLAYAKPLHETGRYDLVLCSYALSMFNPGWEQAIAAAVQDLTPGGHFALVDFHNTAAPAFRRWMQLNHVRMEGHLRPMLQQTFEPLVDRVQLAYGGLWRYHVFIGRKIASEWPANRSLTRDKIVA